MEKLINSFCCTLCLAVCQMSFQRRNNRIDINERERATAARTMPALVHSGITRSHDPVWAQSVQDHHIIIRHPEEQAQVRVAVRDESGYVRGAIIKIYGLPNGEVGVAIESDVPTAEYSAQYMNQQLEASGFAPPVLRRQYGGTIVHEWRP